MGSISSEHIFLKNKKFAYYLLFNIPVLLSTLAEDLCKLREVMMQSISSLVFQFLLVFFLVLGQAAQAGERERQLIVGCFQRGASNFQAMLQCTGMPLTDEIVRSCLSDGPCMESAPWNPRADNGAQQLAWQCVQQSRGSVDVFSRCAVVCTDPTDKQPPFCFEGRDSSDLPTELPKMPIPNFPNIPMPNFPGPNLPNIEGPGGDPSSNRFPDPCRFNRMVPGC